MDLELTEDELFLKMVAWDQTNYIVGAGTSGTSDKNSTDGLVDNHAYSVIESRSNVCGTGIDLLKVRNPVCTKNVSVKLHKILLFACLTSIFRFLCLLFLGTSGVAGKSKMVRSPTS